MIYKFIFISFLLFLSDVVLADAMYGLFMVVKGDVKVTNLKGENAVVKVGSKILPGETVFSGTDSRAKIVMSDRNVINISPGTKMKIEKYENNANTGVKNVELNLTDGKARTNVEQKYDGEKSKFQIKTPTAVAGVRGTQFLISFNSKTQVSQVVTLKGSVSFAAVNAQGVAGKSVEVKKGESTSMASGASAPEAPKVVPKEELKQMDKESSAQTTKPSDSTQASDSNDKPEGKKEGTGEKSDAKKETAGDGKSGDRAPASEGDSAKDTKSADKKAPADAKGDGQANNAPADGTGAPPPPKTAGSMLDKKDMDAGMAKDIKVGGGPASTTPTAMLPPPPPMKPPTIPPIVDSIVKNIYDKTRVIITISK